MNKGIFLDVFLILFMIFCLIIGYGAFAEKYNVIKKYEHSQDYKQSIIDGIKALRAEYNNSTDLYEKAYLEKKILDRASEVSNIDFNKDLILFVEEINARR